MLRRGVHRELEDRIKRVVLHGTGKIGDVFRLVVDTEHPINPGIEGSSGKLVDTERPERPDAGHQHNWRFIVIRTKLGNHAEHLSQIDMPGQRPVGSPLDARHISDQPGERQGKFDDIAPAFGQCVHQRYRELRPRIAGHEECNQRPAAL